MKQIFYEHDSDFTLEDNLPLLIHKCNITQRILPHWHANLEILLPTEGCIEAFIDSKKIIAEPNECIIINSNCLHSIGPIGKTATYRCLILDALFLKNNGLDYTQFIFPEKITDLDSINNIKKLIAQFDSNKSSNQYSFIIRASILHVISCILQQYGLNSIESSLEKETELQKNKTECVKKGIDFIHLHYNEPLQIDDICEHVGISKYHFCRVFKEITNQTVSFFINQIRCSRAEYLLVNSNLSIADCAELCGFSDPSYFTKVYKKHINKLPSQSRLKNKY